MVLDLELVKSNFPTFHEKELQEKIVEHGQLMEARADTLIMDIGSYIKSVPLLLTGTFHIARIDRDKELFLYYLKPGETCAMSLTCCMRNEKSQIRATTEEDSVYIAVPIQYMDEWSKKFTSWKNFVMETYRMRFEELLETIDSIAFTRMDERLAKYLHDKSTTIGSSVINETHQDIAHSLNSTREVISRLLKQMERQGLILLGRNKIQLLT